MKILISGGGTGGHVYPAIAIADALKRIDPSIDILFVGAKGKIEMEKVPKAGFPIAGLWISGLHRKWTVRNLLFPLKLIHSLWKAHGIIRNFRRYGAFQRKTGIGFGINQRHINTLPVQPRCTREITDNPIFLNFQ